MSEHDDLQGDDWGFRLTLGKPWGDVGRTVYDFFPRYGDGMGAAFKAARSARFERH